MSPAADHPARLRLPLPSPFARCLHGVCCQGWWPGAECGPVDEGGCTPTLTHEDTPCREALRSRPPCPLPGTAGGAPVGRAGSARRLVLKSFPLWGQGCRAGPQGGNLVTWYCPMLSDDPMVPRTPGPGNTRGCLVPSAGPVRCGSKWIPEAQGAIIGSPRHHPGSCTKTARGPGRPSLRAQTHPGPTCVPREAQEAILPDRGVRSPQLPVGPPAVSTRKSRSEPQPSPCRG